MITTLIARTSCILQDVRLVQESEGESSRFISVKTVVLPSFVCARNLEFSTSRYRQPRVVVILAVSLHLELAPVHYVSTRRDGRDNRVHRPENMNFVSQDDSLLPLFDFYGGSPFPARSPLLENKFIAPLSSPRIRNVRLKQPVALSQDARNFAVICDVTNSGTKTRHFWKLIL